VIEPDAFRLLNKLKHLNLDSNELTAETIFPVFSNLANLEHLSLKDNRINSLDGLKAISLPRLQVFDLYGDEVTKLSKQSFSTLPGLVNLDLSYNEITEIEPGAFDGLLNLRVLSLFEIQLKVFYFNVFESAANKLGSPINLKCLCLDFSSIESVQWSPKTTAQVNESTSKKKENKKQEEDEAARLFARCGFRNNLDIKLRSEMPDRSFVDALATRKLIRLSFL
jgi:Leucine-rich repeat (LRR) protein